MSRPWPLAAHPERVAEHATHLADDAVLGLIMLSFAGLNVPVEIRERLKRHPVAGVTLFRFLNNGSPSQVRALTDEFQAGGARTGGPLLVAADQEGGQLIAFSDGTTPFAGNMALAATGDLELAERVGRANGLELRAMGINVNFAPVCDVATDPADPALGIRAFGDDPELVGRFVAATVRGLQSAGVAATLKHFPGKGDVAVDTHHELAVVPHGRERFDAVELVPFRAGIAAGARLVMSGHFAVPGLTGSATLPSTLSRTVMHDLLRDELRFDGLAISDALDMRALAQGPMLILEVVAAVRAGLDLLLCLEPGGRARIEEGLLHAAGRLLFERRALRPPLERIDALSRWLAGFEQPGLEVVGCGEHGALARDLAERSITLVRDESRLLPLRLPDGARIAAVMPRPSDLTPADTSSAVAPGLAGALRAHHRLVDEFLVEARPSDAEIVATRDAVRDHDLLVVGTLSASLQSEQVGLVQALLGAGIPTVTVALRTPFDLAAYPQASTHVCSYGILPPSMKALVAALFGRIPFRGRLPAAIPGVYPTGHRLEC